MSGDTFEGIFKLFFESLSSYIALYLLYDYISTLSSARFSSHNNTRVKMISAKASSSFLPEINQKTQKSQSWSRMKSPQRSSSNQLLSIKEIARFRGSVKQQVCVEMLEEGFHRSFSELFSLMRLDCDRRALADPSSLLRVHTPLEEQPDKLQVLREHLSRSELAERTASRSVACDQRQLLAQFFSSTEDSWLSVHFYHSCAERGGSRAATEAQACLAELYLQQGDLQRSLQQAELCVGQADDGGALKRRGELLLIRTLTQMAKSLLDQKQHNEALTLLRRAHDIATDIGEKQMEGEASCLLGVAYQSTGNRDMANQFFNSCLQTYNTLQDADGLVRANLARAESLQRQGLIEETIQCLEELIKMCQSNAMQDKLADVCLRLGVLYYNKGQHRSAYEQLLQSYEAAAFSGDVLLQQKAQVMVGCARAHLLLGPFSEVVASTSGAALRRLLRWKERRRRPDDSAELC